MKAMIFAAGLGTRLKPYTDTMPKALVPLDGKAMLWHQVKRLKEAGVNEIVINVHHFADQIKDYVKQQDSFGITVHISDESACLLDTGGGLMHAARFLEDSREPILIHNVDIFSNLDLKAFIGEGLPQGCMAKLLASDRDSSRKLLFDAESNLRGWKNCRSGELRGPVSADEAAHCTELAFGGVHLVSPEIFGVMKQMMPQDKAFGIVDFYLAACDSHPIKASNPPALQLVDAGKLDTLDSVLKFL